MTIKLAWGAKVSPPFRMRLWDLVFRLNWTDDHANWLMACMAFESACTFSPSCRNLAGSSGTGLIQFMDATAHSLGTTTDELACMTPEQQLWFVEAYFKPYAPRIKSLADMYMAILRPRSIGQRGDAVLYAVPTNAYRLNAGLDKNKDGAITKDEATAKVQAMLMRGMLDGNVWIDISR